MVDSIPNDNTNITKKFSKNAPKRDKKASDKKAVKKEPTKEDLFVSELGKRYKKYFISNKEKLEELKKLKGDYEKLNAEYQEENKLAHEYRSKNLSLNADLNRREQLISQLENTVRQKENDILCLKETNTNLIEELKARESVINMVNKNGSAETEELKNKIASSLKIEYYDFLDAKNQTMSIELGENLKFQLEHIFEILESHGINIGE